MQVTSITQDEDDALAIALQYGERIFLLRAVSCTSLRMTKKQRTNGLRHLQLSPVIWKKLLKNEENHYSFRLNIHS